ncbi:MAG: nucleotidyltransferase domain-containing protein [Melioribacteraceae bacterium]|nr:nucleotidyltransferase domain-containing protein [Melioribacteraceae bacterium]MCF8394324.1 nucleotidyltransferase domain-containing protein [Melioribacteraceae bacterium]MCF8420003.1 nucleotidyltransferase domain-containing protein [Melioribacteraceae bacterium]
MISSEDKYRVLEIAKKYNVSKVYLFGSTLNSDIIGTDIDLAVDGVPDSRYFEFYGELIFALSKPVDLVDLRKKTLFNKMIRTEGVLIYG